MKYKETRILSADKLRALCIERDWYTLGDCEEYSALFDKLRDCLWQSVEMTTEKLAEIAQDIMEHSDLPEDYTITCIMFELARICTTYFEEV